MTDSFREVISTTRSIRRIKPEPVPDDMLNRVLEAALWAPSGGNRQPWRMVVVRDTELKRSLGEIYAREWAVYVDFNMNAVRNADESVRSRVAAGLAVGTRLADTLHEVPVVVLFVHDPSMLYVTDDNLGRTPVVGGASLYPAVQNLLLAARAEGLGGVLTTLISRSEPRNGAARVAAGFARPAHASAAGRDGALRPLDRLSQSRQGTPAGQRPMPPLSARKPVCVRSAICMRHVSICCAA
jgi:nitroreductase